MPVVVVTLATLLFCGDLVTPAQRGTPLEVQMGADGLIPIVVGEQKINAVLHPQIAPLVVIDTLCAQFPQPCPKYCYSFTDYCSRKCKLIPYEQRVSCSAVRYEGARHDLKSERQLDAPELPFGYLARDHFEFETLKNNVEPKLSEKIDIFSAIRLDYRFLNFGDAVIGLKNDADSAIRRIAALLQQPPIVSVAFQPWLPSINRRTTKSDPKKYGAWSDSRYGASIIIGATHRSQCEEFVWTSEGVHDDWTLDGVASWGEKEIANITLLFNLFRYDSLVPRHFFNRLAQLNATKQSLDFTQKKQKLFTLPYYWSAQPVPYPFERPNVWTFGRQFLLEQCIAFDFEQRRIGFARRRKRPAHPFIQNWEPYRI